MSKKKQTDSSPSLTDALPCRGISQENCAQMEMTKKEIPHYVRKDRALIGEGGGKKTAKPSFFRPLIQPRIVCPNVVRNLNEYLACIFGPVQEVVIGNSFQTREGT